MDWFRWHHGSVNDPKFQWVARKAGVRVADVIAVWAAVLERASMSDTRGELSGFDCEDMDVLFGFDDGSTAGILAVMRDKGILVGDVVTAWSTRQPLREDSSAAGRKRRQRDNASCPDMSHNVTHGHADDGTVTQNSARLDKIRLEEKEPLTTEEDSACEHMPLSEAQDLHINCLGKIPHNPLSITVLRDICKDYPPDRIRIAFKAVVAADRPNLNWIKSYLENPQNWHKDLVKKGSRESERDRILAANAESCREFAGGP